MLEKDVQFLEKELWALLAKLKDSTSPKWGQMSAQQMVEHLGSTMIVSYGRIEMQAMLEPDQLAQNYNYMIKGRQRFKQDIKAPFLPDKPLDLRFESLEMAIAKLKKLTSEFFKHYEAHPEAKYMHPVFGILNFNDWVYFHVMHSQYHLDQFGLYEGGAQPRSNK